MRCNHAARDAIPLVVAALVLASSSSHAEALLAVAPAGGYPAGIAVSPFTGLVYATNFYTNTVTVLDPVLYTQVAVLAVPATPIGVLVHPVTGHVYVASSGASAVTVWDGVTHALLETIVLGPAYQLAPLWMAADPGLQRLYVANYAFPGSVSVIDTAVHTLLTTIPVVDRGVSVAVDPLRHLVYVAHRPSGQVSVIDGTTNAVVSVLPVGGDFYGIAVNPVLQRAYVTDFNGGRLVVLDTATNTALATTALPGSPYIVTLSPVTGRVYVTCWNPLGTPSRVAVVEPVGNALEADFPVGEVTWGIAVHPATQRGYAALSAMDSVAVFGLA